MAEQDISLADLLVGLRDQLDEARTRMGQSGRDAILKVQQAEVEIEFAVSAANEVGGGIGFHILSVGAKADRSTTGSHRLSLVLVPVDSRNIVVAAEAEKGEFSAQPTRKTP